LSPVEEDPGRGGAPGAEVFDPVTGSFAPVGGDADTDFSFAAGMRNRDGSVVLIGDYDQSITLTDQVLRYVP